MEKVAKFEKISYEQTVNSLIELSNLAGGQ